ncbi:hypothetical protein Hanom_Chr03g00274311 [Helianthus anomalus]
MATRNQATRTLCYPLGVDESYHRHVNTCSPKDNYPTDTGSMLLNHQPDSSPFYQ